METLDLEFQLLYDLVNKTFKLPNHNFIELR